MKLRIYERYAAEILEANNLHPHREEKVQELIEAYSRDLGLRDDLLERIEGYLARYNRLTAQDLRLRYYQILALLFAEHFFEDQAADGRDERRMLAYWMATGSGKTVVMHLNVLQYLDVLERRRVDYDRLQIVLTTPSVNLIEQHRRELEPFIEALNTEYAGRISLLIETTQALLQHEDDYFTLPADGRTQRLVLVDEGHIGLGGSGEGEFRKLRHRLNEQHSFLFEYSATYHHLGDAETEAEYEDTIIFDYNYARFFRDGYGKDYFFKVVGKDAVVEEDEVQDNLDECFRAIKEKVDAWRSFAAQDDAERVRLYGTGFPPRPLIAFMGNTVDPDKAGKAATDDEVSDIVKVIRHLAQLDDEERVRFRHIFGGDIVGPLVLTRNQRANDEILLSYGEGEYWGIVNVGNGDSFFSSLELEGVEIEKKTAAIVDDRYLFRNIDRATSLEDPDRTQSPINVLIGSRKFAEGWNSFRVGVIGLINLGSSKGNKIIQIFGRGVRLHGRDGSGKRHFREHHGDYFSFGSSDDDRLRKLETLVVLSLKNSYLQKFTEEVQKEVPPATTFTIRVNPVVFRIDGAEVRFEEVQKRLPVFKLTGRRVELKRVVLDGTRIDYEFLEDGKPESGSIKTYQVPLLDYRTDRAEDVPNLAADLDDAIQQLGAFLDRAGLDRHVRTKARDAKMLLLARNGNGGCRTPTLKDLLPFVGEIRYRSDLFPNGSSASKIAILDKLSRRVAEDVIGKLKNRINYVINQSNYVFDQPLAQSGTDNRPKRDFIYEYTVTRTFENEEEREAFEAQLDEEKENLRRLLLVPGELAPPHLYEPVFDEKEAKGHAHLSVSPDLLNPGEKKFIQDFATYVRGRFEERYEFYVLRNVESLKSVGVYLESDEGGYFPDFIVWIVDKNGGPTRILLVDPKGQRGMRADAMMEANEKVTLADKEANGTLRFLEEQLSEAWERSVEIHSFILLRDSSDAGTRPDQDEAWRRDRMVARNILRLDWHARNEQGETSIRRDDLGGASYLDLMLEEAGINVASAPRTNATARH